MRSLNFLASAAVICIGCASAASTKPSAPSANANAPDAPEAPDAPSEPAVAATPSADAAKPALGTHTVRTVEGVTLLVNRAEGTSFQLSVAGKEIALFETGTDFPGIQVDEQVVMLAYARMEDFAQGKVAPGIMLAQHFKWEIAHLKETMAGRVLPPSKLRFSRPKCGVVCADWSIEPAPGAGIPRNVATSIALPDGVLVLSAPIMGENSSEESVREVLYGVARSLTTQTSPFDVAAIAAAERARGLGEP